MKKRRRDPFVSLEAVVAHARDLLDDPRKWTRQCVACDAERMFCSGMDAEAVRFSGYGALEWAAYELMGDRVLAMVLAREACIEMTGANAPRAAMMKLGFEKGRRGVLAQYERFLHGERAPRPDHIILGTASEYLRWKYLQSARPS